MVKPTGLRCEYVENPMGVQSEHPLLSWMCNSNRRGAYQTAYQVVASSSEEKLLAGDYDLWDSGKVESNHSFGVPYNGRKLSSGQRVGRKL